jgi:hypothetical protein
MKKREWQSWMPSVVGAVALLAGLGVLACSKSATAAESSQANITLTKARELSDGNGTTSVLRRAHNGGSSEVCILSTFNGITKVPMEFCR